MYAGNDLRENDVSDAADDRDEVKHVPWITKVVLHRHHKHHHTVIQSLLAAAAAR